MQYAGKKKKRNVGKGSLQGKEEERKSLNGSKRVAMFELELLCLTLIESRWEEEEERDKESKRGRKRG